MSWRLAIAASLLAGCLAGSLQSSAATGARDDAQFDFRALRSIVQHAHSIDQLLAQLPEALRAQYALVYASRSEQEASYQAPRILLHTRDARFVLTFNGDPSERGFDRVETLEFETRSRRFVFREIAFDPGMPARISQDNPARCLKCHGSEPRPIWDTYPSWPGVYGRLTDGPSDLERERLIEFVQTHANRARYRSLLNTAILLARGPSQSLQQYEGRAALSPNAAFGANLQRLQYLAIAARVTRAPKFRRFGYALLASLNPQCVDITRFMPPTSLGRSIAEFERQTTFANLAQAAAKANREATPARHAELSENLTAFRYVVEAGLGLATDEFTLAFEVGTYDFSAPTPLTDTLEREIARALSSMDAGLPALYAQRHDEDVYCTELERRSIAAR